jgi:blue copper oxidase
MSNRGAPSRHEIRPKPLRTIPRGGAVHGAALLLLGIACTGCTTSGPNAPGNAVFEVPLPIPPLLEGHLEEGGQRVFELEARDGAKEFVSGVETPTRGVNGDHLGPTLRMPRGEEVIVRLTNHLDEATTMHWHGMELPAAMDGGPHQMIPPGETWMPTWEVEQPAATLWYHPHPHGETERHVYSGMAGMILVEDEEASALPLPRDYGVDDIPVLVQDISLDDRGALVRHQPWYNQVGPLGRIILVNGEVAPRLEAGRERIRLRLLNASISRVYNFGFSDDRTFALIASDGGLLGSPHYMDRIQLSPGERAEIVIQLAANDRTILRSFPQDLGTDFVNHRLAGGNDVFDLMEIRATADLIPSPELPSTLVPLPEPKSNEVERTRTFQVSSQAINGREMDMNRIDAHVKAGSTEIWEVEGIAVPHNLHIHGVRFRVLDVDGVQPGPALSGWKDTVYLEPDRVTRILIRFPADADEVPFMFHCHLLRHEDLGAMGQFLVVGAGMTNTNPHSSHAHDSGP